MGGYFCFAFGTLVSWSCHKIRAIVLSVHESEIYMMSLACREARWMSRLYGAMRVKITLPIPLYCDNQGAIDTSSNIRLSAKTKHIAVRNLYVREAYTDGLVKPVWTKSQDNLSDLLTKPTAFTIFSRLNEKVAWGSPPPPGLTRMKER